MSERCDGEGEYFKPVCAKVWMYKALEVVQV